MTRRVFLLDLGAAVAAVTLAACTGSSGDAARTPDSSPTSGAGPGATGGATTGSTTAPDAAGKQLAWERVLGGAAAAYVLVRAGEATVVDTGQQGTAAELTTALGALGSTWTDVSTVVLTHRHPDHVGGLGEVANLATGARLATGAGDVDAISASRALVAIGNGDRIMGLEVVETPGHTPGHVSVFDPGTGVLVAGDALNSGDAGEVTGPNPSFTTDMDRAWASADVLAGLEPSVILVGHGPPVQPDAASQLRELVDAEGPG